MDLFFLGNYLRQLCAGILTRTDVVWNFFKNRRKSDNGAVLDQTQRARLTGWIVKIRSDPAAENAGKAKKEPAPVTLRSFATNLAGFSAVRTAGPRALPRSQVYAEKVFFNQRGPPRASTKQF